MNNLIKFFHAAPTNGKLLDPALVIAEAAKRGYLPQTACCTQEVLNFVKSEEYNPNSTFYKTFADVTNKDRFELLIDQLLHYADVYGLGRRDAEVYCPNGDPINIDYRTYTVIKAVTPREFYDMCINCINAGAALATTTLDSLIAYIVERVQKDNYPIDLSAVANRDAQCMLSVKLGLYPTDGAGIIRVLYYKVFGNPMPIQGHMQLNALYGRKTRWGGRTEATANVANIDLTTMTNEQKVALSEVFYRYKKFLLGLKRVKKNRAVINQLRRMAEKNHKPTTLGFWETITNLSRKEVAERLEKELDKLDNNFKIARLIQMFELRRLQNLNKSRRIFTVRNGKVWLDKNSVAPYAGWWQSVREALVMKLIENIKAKRLETSPYAQYVKFPKNLELACPVSEKKFLGNVPFGSVYNLAGSNNYFGVYWRNEWGTHDFDLSFVSDQGNKLGWNSDYYNEGKNIVFSGDMTNAAPEATEMFYASGDVELPNGNLILNRYSGEPDSQWRLFFGQDKISNFGKNYMVDPNTILFSEMGKSTSKEQIVGRIQDGKLLVCVADLSDQRVSCGYVDRNQSFADQAQSYLMLKDILLRAGYYEYTDEIAEKGIAPTLDLTDLNKDTLLNLFS
jgi:hypothetical protein